MKQPPPGCSLITEGPAAGRYRVDDLDELMRSKRVPVSCGWDMAHCPWCNGVVLARPHDPPQCPQCRERFLVECVDGGGKCWVPDPERETP